MTGLTRFPVSCSFEGHTEELIEVEGCPAFKNAEIYGFIEPVVNVYERFHYSPEMVFVEGGSFQMGSADEDSNEDEQPVHKVTVSSFLIGKYPVTQREYECVMYENPSYSRGRLRPVEEVRWYDAIVYCNLLSMREGRTPCYVLQGSRNPSDWGKVPNGRDNDEKWDKIECDWNADGYRLPTEAEWEYAARGGQQSKGFKYAGSDNLDDVGWYADNKKNADYMEDNIQAVGQKQANELDLYDMSGNVWELCWDWFNYDYYGKSPGNNPVGPSSGTHRVIRGGDCLASAESCRLSFRRPICPGYQNIDLFGPLLVYQVGFRLVCARY